MIQLNVGGTMMTAKRSTLCQIKDSFLASAFGGNWDKTQQTRDKDGFLFLDFNPAHFGIVLNYLREKAFSTSEVLFPLSKVGPKEIESFVKLVEYLGLSDEMRMSKLLTSEVFKFGFKLEEDGAVAGVEINRSRRCRAVGQNTYKDGVFSIILKLEEMNLQDDSYFVEEAKIGMITDDLDIDNSDYISSLSKLYGWGFHKKKLIMYSNTMKGTQGEKIAEPSEAYSYWMRGKIIELILDCNVAKLYMNTPDSEQYHVELPKWSKYKLAVYSDNCNMFKIRIVECYKIG